MYGRHKKKTGVEVQGRHDITDYVRNFKRHMRNTRGRVFDLRNRGEVECMKDLMNRPENTTFKSLKDIWDGNYYWYDQKVDFVPSNLRRGFIFYFICNECERRVKYLYEYAITAAPLCRTCCRLSYEQPNRKSRALSRLIRKPYLSTEGKYILIKKTGLTLEDFYGASIK